MRRLRRPSIMSCLTALALGLISLNAFRQVPENLWDPEPGSVLFGVLHVVIGTAAAAGIGGLLQRAKWAAWAIGVSGVAAMTLLIAQPLFDPMPSDALRSLGFGIAAVGAITAGLSWHAQRVSVSRRPDQSMPPDAPTPPPAIGAPDPLDSVARSVREDASARVQD